MTIHITATQLRKDVYRLLDQVVDSGEGLEVKRKGERIQIVPVDPCSKLESLRFIHSLLLAILMGLCAYRLVR